MQLDWHNIDTALLDMDGTLLNLHYDNFVWLEHLPKRYAEIHDKAEGDARRELDHRFDDLRGSLRWYCLDYWSSELDLDIPALKAEVKHLIQVRPFVEEFLQLLRSRGKRVVLVTNAHHHSLSLKLARTGLEPCFDQVICSHSYQLPKEDPQFWVECRLTEPFEPTRTLMIDDNAAVLESARQYGIRHLLTLLQPDSRRAVLKSARFPAIVHFDEILPGLRGQ